MAHEWIVIRIRDMVALFQTIVPEAEPCDRRSEHSVDVAAAHAAFREQFLRLLDQQ